MLLEGKNAVIYGAAGAIGSAVARTFATEGARLFLAGRTLVRVKTVADEVRSRAAAAQVDANDEPAVQWHLDAVVRNGGASPE